MYKYILIGLITTSCVGTDVIDDPVRDPQLTIQDEDQDRLVTMLIGETEQLTSEYFNEFGIAESIEPTWIIDNPTVASVSNGGLVTANSKGQSYLRASFNGTSSADILISVAENLEDIVKVLISEPSNSKIEVSETLQLDATGWNLNNMPVNGLEVNWSVDNPTIASIDNSGLLTGLDNGKVFITATIDGVKSIPLEIEVGSNTLTAQFEGRSGYIAEGTATLETDSNGDLILSFSDDFKTSFALGTFIYLSNSTSGSQTKGAGLQLAEITTNGAKSFNVSEIESSVQADTYRYVIILCFPASITFGVADFQN